MSGYLDIVGQAPDMKLEELYHPAMVSITIVDENESETFHVPRELICTRSDYFRAAFNGRFIESTTLTITLEETSIWTFKTFIGWLYTSRLTLPQSPAGLLGEQGRANDPTTWPFKILFEFDDSRPTRKAIRAQLGDAPVAFWWIDDIGTARAALPQYCFECLLLRYLHLPQRVCDGHAREPYDYNDPAQRWCFWHEHQNEDPEGDEKLVCKHQVKNYEARLAVLEDVESEHSRLKLWTYALG
ncbi:hypothetical protein CERZMDRAFT_99542 [Cercospora zeae-maydis SCOH1-5]|uniref:BTB domain-containing protein n=1 Tax=Cercospora zeae-maydis SCOH1-5 TaxID=717836 RepID=A0A6A6FAV7_9PEZI|nr:hypothetical protein CERZMDRAFT_99542 [Cercospora zeae-maydis SCOH1-5]